LGATKNPGEGKGRDREHPANAKFHGIFPESGSVPAAGAKRLIRRF
jgi:hypothetical protein